MLDWALIVERERERVHCSLALAEIEKKGRETWEYLKRKEREKKGKRTVSQGWRTWGRKMKDEEG